MADSLNDSLSSILVRLNKKFKILGAIMEGSLVT
jgi:hypothetical protein